LCSLNEELNLLKVSVLKISFLTALHARAADVINTLSIIIVLLKVNKKDKIVKNASVELTQTRHSHSKQLFHGAQISRGFYREGQKATYAACKPLFLAVAEI